ncbi:MAG: bifunctional sugar-1-phosphate nucleotidylyltransferase/acetyltransferase [Candidatus Paceibacterota bacterium]|jgi:bifunctional UDP-N-acetylglucosamine pyrophosphorylase/glucosamine-1-phosphate N-acetyltransferase
MQAIILAAGNGVRFHPFSENKPKPLFSFLGKTTIEHNLSELNGLVNEVLVVVGYKKEMIMDALGDNYGKIRIKYIEDNDVCGTGSSARLAKDFLEDKFIILNGDDFYSKEDIKKVIDNYPSILVKEHNNPTGFGVVIEKDGYLEELIEKPKETCSNLVNTGLYCLNKNIFDLNIEKSERGEYELTDYIKKSKERINVCKAFFWSPASYPWDIFNAFLALFSRIKKSKDCKIEKGATISKEAIIKKGTIIKSGSYIEGKVFIGENCIIGPNCLIKGDSSIEDNCKIGHSVEIKNSIIGKGTNINHLSYVGDSIIGENCNLGAGTITANLRHDKNNVKVKIKESLIDSGRLKLGVMMGDNIKTGIGTLIYPGRKINKNTLPGDKVI